VSFGYTVLGFGSSSGSPFVSATGGSITTSGDYTIHTFNSSGTFTVTSAGADGAIDYLIVAGGGSGGDHNGGGGGAGGLLTGSTTVSAGTGYSLVIGSGGSRGNPGGDGANSTAFSLTAIGGGGGGAQSGSATG